MLPRTVELEEEEHDEVPLLPISDPEDGIRNNRTHSYFSPASFLMFKTINIFENLKNIKGSISKTSVVGVIGLLCIFTFLTTTTLFGVLYYKLIMNKPSKLPKWPSPSHSLLGEYSTAAVAADNDLCSEIGRDILLQGGNAVDAAIVLCSSSMEAVQKLFVSVFDSVSNLIALFMIHLAQFKDNVLLLSGRFETNGFLPELQQMYERIEPTLPVWVVLCKEFCQDKLEKIIELWHSTIQAFKNHVDPIVASLRNSLIWQGLEHIYQQAQPPIAQLMAFFKEYCEDKLDKFKLKYQSAIASLRDYLDSMLAFLHVEQIREFVNQQLNVYRAGGHMQDHGLEGDAKKSNKNCLTEENLMLTFFDSVYFSCGVFLR